MPFEGLHRRLRDLKIRRAWRQKWLGGSALWRPVIILPGLSALPTYSTTASCPRCCSLLSVNLQSFTHPFHHPPLLKLLSSSKPVKWHLCTDGADFWENSLEKGTAHSVPFVDNLRVSLHPTVIPHAELYFHYPEEETKAQRGYRASPTQKQVPFRAML